MIQDRIQVDLPDNRSYSVYQSPLSSLPERMQEHGLKPGKCLLITDLNVGTLYSDRLEQNLEESGWLVKNITLPPGEQTKSARYLQEIYDVALDWGIDRHTPILALGGGVVGDIAGFAASTLLRGVPLIHLPTTLLAQVDSSIGGKTGINHESGKNLIGSFYQPVFVCSDTNTLTSLPLAEWTGGLSEVVKHALIDDPEHFAWISDNSHALLTRDQALSKEWIRKSVAIKARIVSADEKEKGLRAILNFGHTFGHAIEKVTGYGTLSHGEAVLLGMKAAIHISSERNPEADFLPAHDVLSRFPTTTLSEEISFAAIREAINSDKKAQKGAVRFVLLSQIGKAYISADVTDVEMESAWNEAVLVE